MDLITPIVIVVLVIAGSAIHYFAGKPDTCAEELVEQILRIENVNIDFSAAEHRAARNSVVSDNIGSSVRKVENSAE